MSDTWTVVGLGNPGDKYKNTRHNVGRMAVEVFAETQAAGEVNIVLPETYMNLSGGPVKRAMRDKTVDKLIIVHDDIDLPFGEVKVSVGKGSGGQKGVEDIIKALGTKEFVRVRIGIIPSYFGTQRKPKGTQVVSRFVLKPFGILERMRLADLLNRASDAVTEVVRNGPSIAMNKCN